MYRSYSVRPLPNPTVKPTARKAPFLIITIILIVLIYCMYCLLRVLPPPKTVITPPVSPALVKVNIPWPTVTPTTQSAYGAQGYGLLDSNGAQTPVPTASVAKVITALAVLQQKPLRSGESGPSITITDNDVAIYNQYVAKDGSVVPVYAGEQISEYQALQALMLPSANNVADTLANWAFGSMNGYTTFANQYAKKLGMTQTTINDASGFSPNTVSTASDLIVLGNAALENPVLREIVGQRSATFPQVGTIYNVNTLLGQSNIIGIKTGNTDEAGGCFLTAATVDVGNGNMITAIAAVMKAPDLASAMRGSVPLLQSTASQFQTTHIVRAGQKLGTVTTAWGSSSQVTASKDISVTAWSGTTLPALVSKSNPSRSSQQKAGSIIGSVSFDYKNQTQTSNLTLVDPISAPSPWWRLTHPL